MNKRLFILYTIVFLLTGVMLYLYRVSYRDLRFFISDVNRVSSVIVGLERLDALIHFWASNDREQNYREFYLPSGAAYDSIGISITRLQSVVLYQEERLRLDTIRRSIREYQRIRETVSDTTGSARQAYLGEIDKMMQRCFTFARTVLSDRKARLGESTELLDKWLQHLLILAGVFIVLATFYSFNFLEQRRRAEGLSHTILNNTTNGIVSVVPVMSRNMVRDYRINYFNEAAVKVLGQRLQKNSVLSSLFAGEEYEGIRKTFDEVIARKESRILEGYLEEGGGRNYLQATLVALQDGLLISISNLSTLKRYEQRLTYKIRQLKIANDELTQYAYITSHDLQEPLRKIQMFTDIARSNTSELQRKEEMLAKIFDTATHMRDLVQTLLHFTRITNTPEKFSMVNLNEVVSKSLQDLEEEIRDSEAVIEVGRLPLIKGSALHLGVLFTNLISNSIKYARPGDVPRVEIREHSVSPDDFESYPDLSPATRYTHITVTDHGVGFPPEMAAKIFTIFQRLHNKDGTAGNGIGLAICRKIVHQHHGLIFANGRENAGVTISMFLPFEPPPAD